MECVQWKCVGMGEGAGGGEEMSQVLINTKR